MVQAIHSACGLRMPTAKGMKSQKQQDNLKIKRTKIKMKISYHVYLICSTNLLKLFGGSRLFVDIRMILKNKKE